jgi:hypothetical protein
VDSAARARPAERSLGEAFRHPLAAVFTVVMAAILVVSFIQL